MKKNNIIFMFLVSVSLYAKDDVKSEFVIKPSKPRVSNAHLKEEIVRAYADLAKETSSLTCEGALCGHAIVCRTEELIDGETQAQSKQLAEHLNQLKIAQAELQKCNEKISSVKKMLNQGIKS